MKFLLRNESKKFITDNSNEIDSDGIFLLTEQNKIYKKDVEKKGFAFFLTPEELFFQWELEKIKIIGITGTNGKTTTTNIIAHILKNLEKKVVASGTEGIFFHTSEKIEKISERGNTTPDIFSTLINLKKAKDKGAEFFVMEVSSHGIFQKRIEGIKFSAKIFTNLSQDHLDFHKTFENYCDVKSSFFSDENSVKIINGDDKNIKFNKKNSFLYSVKNKNSDIFSNNIKYDNGISGNIFLENEKAGEVYLLETPVLGKFNLYNILASILVLKKITNFSVEKILENLRNFSGVDGRMEIIFSKKEKDRDMEILVDYAHTPDAIEKVLKSIQKKKTKIITIIGAGGDRDKTKRPIMAKVSCENSNKVFLTSDNSRFEDPEKILEDMESGLDTEKLNYEYTNFSTIPNHQIILDRKKAIITALRQAEKIFQKGESVMIAILGKGNENYLDVQGEKKPYSDKKEVLEFFNVKK